MATELLVAIKTHKKTVHSKMVSQQQVSQSFPDHPTREHICVCTNLAEIDLPPSYIVCIVLLITPLQTISVVCITVAIAPTVMCFLQLGNHCYAGSCKFGRDCGHFSQCLTLVALVAAVGTFYFYLLPQGTTISSTMGVIWPPSTSCAVCNVGGQRKIS